VDENSQNLNNNGPWWKPGMQLLSEVSTWIVGPIVMALIFGKMLDTHYGTKPVIFLCFAGAGFLVTCFGIYRVMKRYMKKLQSMENKDQKKI
jgi:F0F1-type ATP synthase assembly protein I